MTSEAIVSIDASLRRLTDFQASTVDAVCQKLVGNDGLGGRVLVADEVGLGKTLVARGVIAKVLRHRLIDGPPQRPLRVVYICSNLALAHENVRKLAIFHKEEARKWVSTPHFGRLAELGLRQSAAPPGVLMELCSLTPATSFTLSQGSGNALERAIIWRAVATAPYVEDTQYLESFFRKGVAQAWEYAKSAIDGQGGLDETVCSEYHLRLGDAPLLDARGLSAARELGLSIRSWRTLLKGISEIAADQVQHQSHLTSFLRRKVREMFVESCAKNLRADLFILDEFQRFADLINVPADDGTGDESLVISEQHVIAKRVLHEGNGYGTLLLSATPFKALTHLGEEEEGTAHAQELNRLLQYLSGGDAFRVGEYEIARKSLLRDILNLPVENIGPKSLSSDGRRAVESLLRHYICRTERLGIEPDVERLFQNVEMKTQAPDLAEIKEFVALDQLSEALKRSCDGTAGLDVMNFYKAAPWCLSFLGGYTFRENLRAHQAVPDVSRALDRASMAWIPYEQINHYKIDLQKEAPSSRFKQLLEVAAPLGAEQLLWVPPSLPNYLGEGPFSRKEGFSKSLLFSSLVLAPRALSGLVSYECERRLMPKGRKRHRYFEQNDDATRTFRFEAKSLSPAWSLVYPCRRLATLWQGTPGQWLGGLRATISSQLSPDLERLSLVYGKGARHRGTQWYTLAPILLDWITPQGQEHAAHWLRGMTGISESAATRKNQVERLLTLLEQRELEIGEPPGDLLDYLVDLAIAGPGICLLRSIQRGSEAVAEAGDEAMRQLVYATDAALSFIDKMNRVESQRVLRAVCGGDKPWVALVRYAVMGNLQAVFDEYVHLLRSIHTTTQEVVRAFQAAVGTGSVSVTAQRKLPPPKKTHMHDVRFHCHYAVPLGNQKGADEKGVERITNVRASFNSPFWPFLLNSTSIGQEGLDFHWYCRRVIHWNLPSNPIDLEQREGRVNRYKSLVVRQRIASTFGGQVDWSSQGDLWDRLFDGARSEAKAYKAGQRLTDLVPFWHAPSGAANIERMVPAMPFSAESARLLEVLRILALYRLAFGQPRQQELLENLLHRNYNESDLVEIRRAMLVDLAPINYMENSPGVRCPSE